MNTYLLLFIGAVLGVAIPLAIRFVIEPYLYRRKVARNRVSLLQHGLTPERYLATIPVADCQRRAKAMLDFDL